MIRFHAALCLLVMVGCSSRGDADLVLRNASVCTMEDSAPWASAVAVKGNSIVAVPEEEVEVDAFIGPGTRVVDLDGAFVLPGFIDGHVHFNSAGTLLRDANLLRVSGDDGLRAELSRVVGILENGEWITGGNWGAYAFRSLLDSGTTQVFGGDWPGTNAAWYHTAEVSDQRRARRF